MEFTAESVFVNGFVLALGVFAPAHHLIHQKSWWMKAAGNLGFTLIGAQGAGLDHILTHHKKVGKKCDSTHRPPNQRFWAGFAKSVCQQELVRLKTRKADPYDCFFVAIAIGFAVFTPNHGLVYFASIILVRMLIEVINHLSHLNHDWIEGPNCQSAKLLERFLFFGANVHGAHHHDAPAPGYALECKEADHTFKGGYIPYIVAALLNRV